MQHRLNTTDPIYFENEENRQKYEDIPVECPAKDFAQDISNNVDEGIDEG
ncbi:MAG: hypothetical protein KZQ64_11615 [gamma proteobacterium symbiont of Bathyaustriella thionipta]|nr:hypothetical protein [gamma proteobacterium symbiont of Bathyaustriella thionipta]MCU7951386.1 hypothetical protein [gamma proteobacterium symbiont of Bathyaustriella thionipta]MCU7954018.1 hypothetical protein [gamma proteobacterium symbiont of Bathyaustriella thionipta]MCU7957935.1 hypothetical protein [gamma proteobacterium symbiont of Bathyaustriella thionipta]MCU7967850.1 hypothetical protein [gamma proteobacterium symbiont of Bathyaustriella thionipta]